MANVGRSEVADFAGGSRLRTVVVGAGAIAQAMHLPHLARLPELFELAGLVEASEKVRAHVCASYGISHSYGALDSALEEQNPDAVIVSTPSALHAEAVISALTAGANVFVEKPMCITLEDADRIIELSRERGLTVQVGYMNRFDPAALHLASELARDGDIGDLRHISVLINDPEDGPYLGRDRVVRASDVPESQISRLVELETDQVAQAIGSVDPMAIRSFVDGYLGSLVHQVNLVRMLLASLDAERSVAPISTAWWAGGSAIVADLAVGDKARWANTWMQLVDVPEYREQIVFYFKDSIRSLTFPSPWLNQAPTVYRAIGGSGTSALESGFRSYEEAFLRQFEHFHGTIAGDLAPRNTPVDAREDIRLLTELFALSPVEGAAGIGAARVSPSTPEEER